ncbi:MAG: hypothetical protein AAF298_26555 [Cyanobacteria bacterium P01_A01_bin.40]
MPLESDFLPSSRSARLAKFGLSVTVPTQESERLATAQYIAMTEITP